MDSFNMPKKHDKTGRSLYPEGQFVLLPYRLLKSDAWRSLSGGSIKVYLELHTRFNGKNNGQLFVSLDNAAKALGLSKSTVQRAFQELEEHGFIVKTTAGSWYKGKATEWRLTTQTYKNQSKTDDWKNFTAKEKINPRKPYGRTKRNHDKNFPQKDLSVPP